MKFTIQVYENLIELVKHNPPLYDPSIEDYKDHVLHRHIWKKIAQEMNEADMTWKDWKKVWRLKRDEFTRKRREISKQPTAAAAKKIRKGPLFDHMTFLVDYISGRKSVSNMMDYNNQERFSEDEESHKEVGDLNGAGALKQEMLRIPVSTSRSASPSSATGITCITSSTSHGICEEDNKLSVIKKVPGIAPCNSTPWPTQGTCEVDNIYKHTIKTSSHHEVKKPPSYRISRKASEEDDDQISISFEQSSTPYPVVDRTMTKCNNDEEDHSSTCVFSFLSEKMENFLESTQQWVEDEVLKIYMEAKRRDRMERSHRAPYHYRYQCQQTFFSSSGAPFKGL